MAVHLHRINVEFPAAVWSVVVTLPDSPKVGDPIEVKGTPCVVREIEARPGDGSDVQSVAATVYAEPTAEDGSSSR